MIYKVLPNQKEWLQTRKVNTPAAMLRSRTQAANRRICDPPIRFIVRDFCGNPGPGMLVAHTRLCVSLFLIVILPASLLGQALPDQPRGAILHADGGVWVNGYETHDSSAVFPGDVIETKSGASANLSMDGSTVLLAPESVGKFQGDLLELDHGIVSVVTTKSFKVRVNCIRVIPVINEWTQYVVTDLNGSVQVNAQKKDVNVEHERNRGKAMPEKESSEHASVHEGEQKSYDESEICGAPSPPNSAVTRISPKWIAAGAAGAGLLLCTLIHCFGSGATPKPQMSPSGF